MTKFKIGDIIALPYFPNEEDKNEGTARPVLIVEVFNDSYSIIPLTTQLHQSKNYKKTIEIKKSSSIGIKMGITADSLLIVDRKMEIKKIIAKPPVLGNCGQDFLDEHNL